LIDVPHDYTVFVQLLGNGPLPVAQRDAKPRTGSYPTDLWEEGEEIVDHVSLEVPAETRPGEYDLVIGMYRLETLERLVTTDGGGERLPGDMVVLTKVRVE
jgi:hypothetical protein